MPDGMTPHADWAGSVTDAADQVLYPWVTSSAPATLGVWAGLAVLLPVLVRGRSLGLDLLGGAIWGAACVIAHKALGELAGSSLALPEPRGVLLGALAGVALAAVAGAVGLIGAQAPPWHESSDP
jgi:hypothetical protein